MFLLFAGEDLYPSGGANDFKSWHAGLDEAIEQSLTDKLIAAGCEWLHVFSVDDEEIVARYFEGAWHDKNDNPIEQKQ